MKKEQKVCEEMKWEYCMYGNMLRNKVVRGKLLRAMTRLFTCFNLKTTYSKITPKS